MNITLITSIQTGIENNRLEQEASKLGHTLTIINPKNITLVINDNKLSYPELDSTNPEVVILRGVLHAIKKTVTLIDYLRSKNIKVFDNNLSQMQYSINKVSDLTKLSLHQIPLPNTRHSENYEHFPKLASELGYPLIIKPLGTGKGIGINKISSISELNQFISDRQEKGLPAKSQILQQFIDYNFDLRVLVIGETAFCMRRIPVAGDFRANFSLGGNVELFEADQETKELAVKALASINMSIGGVDVLITKTNEKFILEVNHSPGFEGMEKATGQNIASLLLNHCLSNAR